MERLLIAGLSLSIYAAIGLLIQYFITAPSHLHRKAAKDYIGQHVSLIHGIFAIFSSITVYFIEGGIHYEADTNIYHLLVLGHSLGYFYYDMIYAEVYGIHDNAMRFHHISTISGGTALYLANKGGSTAVSKLNIVCVIVTELSNPFMQIRLILKARKENNTWLYKKIEEAFGMVFIFNRLVIGTFVNYNMWAANIGIGIKIAVSSIYYVGLYWVFAILSLFAKKMRQKNDKPKGVLALFFRVINWIRNNIVLFLGMTFIWSFAFPYITTQVMEASYKNIRLKNFIIV